MLCSAYHNKSRSRDRTNERRFALSFFIPSWKHQNAVCFGLLDCGDTSWCDITLSNKIDKVFPRYFDLYPSWLGDNNITFKVRIVFEYISICTEISMHGLPLPLAFNVSLDDFHRRAANRSTEIRRTPKVSTPQAILERGELLKESARRYAFEAIDELRNLMIWFDSYDHMDMVNFVLSCYQFNVRFFAKLFKYLSASITNLTSHNRATILNAPNDMHCQQIDRMTTRFKLIFHGYEFTLSLTDKVRKQSPLSVFCITLFPSAVMAIIVSLSLCATEI
jgi:hypothetical protein